MVSTIALPTGLSAMVGSADTRSAISSTGDSRLLGLVATGGCALGSLRLLATTSTGESFDQGRALAREVWYWEAEPSYANFSAPNSVLRTNTLMATAEENIQRRHID